MSVSVLMELMSQQDKSTQSGAEAHVLKFDRFAAAGGGNNAVWFS